MTLGQANITKPSLISKEDSSNNLLKIEDGKNPYDRRIEGLSIPEKTAYPGYALEILFTTEKKLKKIAGCLEVAHDLVKRDAIRNIGSRGPISPNLNVYDLRVLQGIYNKATDNPNRETLYFSNWSELYRTCGVKEYISSSGRQEIDGHDKDGLREAILRLREKNFDIVLRIRTGYDKTNKRYLYDVVASREPLFKIDFVYKNVPGNKVGTVIRDAVAPGDHNKISGIIIRPNPCLLLNPKYVRWINTSLYHDIRDVLGPDKRVSKYDFLFLFWLHRHKPGRNPIETNLKALAEELGMGRFIQRSQWGKINEMLERAYWIAHEAGYLQQPAGHLVTASRGKKKEVFYLNPEKVIQAKKKTKSSNNPDKKVWEVRPLKCNKSTTKVQ